MYKQYLSSFFIQKNVTKKVTYVTLFIQDNGIDSETRYKILDIKNLPGDTLYLARQENEALF